MYYSRIILKSFYNQLFPKLFRHNRHFRTESIIKLHTHVTYIPVYVPTYIHKITHLRVYIQKVHGLCIHHTYAHARTYTYIATYTCSGSTNLQHRYIRMA